MPIIRAHHESWDRPITLIGNDRPFLARVIVVCDSWDARVYHQRMPPTHAEQVIRERGAFQWTPEVVEALLLLPLSRRL